jgi:hypothetical protein
MTIGEDRQKIIENASRLSPDEWQAFSNREAALAIASWFEADGKRLERPIRTLTLRELEAIADNAISRWIVVNSTRLLHKPEASEDLKWLYMA